MNGIATGSVLMTLGKRWLRVGFEVIGLIVLVTAAVMLAPRFGAAGMPLAPARSEWMMTLLGWGMTCKLAWRSHRFAGPVPQSVHGTDCLISRYISCMI